MLWYDVVEGGLWLGQVVGAMIATYCWISTIRLTHRLSDGITVAFLMDNNANIDKLETGAREGLCERSEGLIDR